MVDEALAARIRRVRFVVFDFDGVFTDNSVFVAQDGSESVRCSRSDGFGLRKLERAGLELMILSTEVNPVISVRAKKLAVPCVQGCDDKLAALKAMVAERGLKLDQVAFVGNDINDASCLGAVGLPIVVHDAWPEVLGLAAYRTTLRGGYGAVREVGDLFEHTLTKAGAA